MSANRKKTLRKRTRVSIRVSDQVEGYGPLENVIEDMYVNVNGHQTILRNQSVQRRPTILLPGIAIRANVRRFEDGKMVTTRTNDLIRIVGAGLPPRREQAAAALEAFLLAVLR